MRFKLGQIQPIKTVQHHQIMGVFLTHPWLVPEVISRGQTAGGGAKATALGLHHPTGSS